MKTFKNDVFRFILTNFLVLCVAVIAAQSEYIQKLENDLYVEGYYAENVSGPALELVSLHRNIEPYDWEKQQDLYIEFKAPYNAPYRIKAQEKRIKRYYMMQSKVKNTQDKSNVFGPWPVDNYLQSRSVETSNLGVVLNFDTDKLKHAYLPLDIYHTCLSERASTYKAVFRINRLIRAGIYNIYAGIHEGEIANDAPIIEKNKEIGQQSIRSIMQLSVPIEKLASYKNNWLTVDVQLQETSNLKIHTFRFYVYHSG